MAEMVLNTSSLPEPLLRMIRTEKVRVKESDGIIQLMPVQENIDCTIGLRGILAGYDELSVEKFLERKHADKDLDL